jgi:hypothetical protein
VTEESMDDGIEMDANTIFFGTLDGKINTSFGFQFFPT